MIPRKYLILSAGLVLVGTYFLYPFSNTDDQSVLLGNTTVHKEPAGESGGVPVTSATSIVARDAATYRPLDFLFAPKSELVDRDISSDVAKLRKQALAGSPDAAYDLYRSFATCSVTPTESFCTSENVEVDEGISMLRKAAELNYWPAHVDFLRALYIHQGPPTEDDINLGLAYLHSAAENGAADAMFRLANFSVNRLNFIAPREPADLPGDLGRAEAYGHFLAAASVYENLEMRQNVVTFISDMNTQLSPSEVYEALDVARDLLGKPTCCRVWKP